MTQRVEFACGDEIIGGLSADDALRREDAWGQKLRSFGEAHSSLDGGSTRGRVQERELAKMPCALRR